MRRRQTTTQPRACPSRVGLPGAKAPFGPVPGAPGLHPTRDGLGQVAPHRQHVAPAPLRVGCVDGDGRRIAAQIEASPRRGGNLVAPQAGPAGEDVERFPIGSDADPRSAKVAQECLKAARRDVQYLPKSARSDVGRTLRTRSRYIGGERSGRSGRRHRGRAITNDRRTPETG